MDIIEKGKELGRAIQQDERLSATPRQGLRTTTIGAAGRDRSV